MRSECEKYHGRQREICEGTANLSSDKINAYRERWGLPSLQESEIQGRPSDLPPSVQRALSRAKGIKALRSEGPRPSNKASTRRPQARSSKSRSGGCGGCGGSSRIRRTAPLEPVYKLNGYGPGSQLLKLWADMPHCDACEELAAKMDTWGKSGCTARLDEIVADILPRAQLWMAENKPWFHRILSITATEKTALRIGISHKVRQAISLAAGD